MNKLSLSAQVSLDVAFSIASNMPYKKGKDTVIIPKNGKYLRYLYNNKPVLRKNLYTGQIEIVNNKINKTYPAILDRLHCVKVILNNRVSPKNVYMNI